MQKCLYIIPILSFQLLKPCTEQADIKNKLYSSIRHSEVKLPLTNIRIHVHENGTVLPAGCAVMPLHVCEGSVFVSLCKYLSISSEFLFADYSAIILFCNIFVKFLYQNTGLTKQVGGFPLHLFSIRLCVTLMLFLP